jgi:hypothetical protein
MTRLKTRNRPSKECRTGGQAVKGALDSRFKTSIIIIEKVDFLVRVGDFD